MLPFKYTPAGRLRAGRSGEIAPDPVTVRNNYLDFLRKPDVPQSAGCRRRIRAELTRSGSQSPRRALAVSPPAFKAGSRPNADNQSTEACAFKPRNGTDSFRGPTPVVKAGLRIVREIWPESVPSGDG